MTTGDKWVNLAMKRFLSANRLKANFLEYLQNGVFETLSVMLPEQGLFTFPVTVSGNGLTGTVSVTPDPIVGTDGEGHVLSLIGSDRTANVPFPNENGQRFWLGLKWCVAPENVYSNPRTGVPEYDLWREEVGECGAPDSVVDQTSNIKLVVDSLFANGVDFSGRTVTVWLVNPLSADETVAFEDCTVQYDGGSGENYIETLGLLGQTTVSVVASNYQVACFGMTIVKSALNPFASDYTVLGWVEGGVIGTLPTSQDGQKDLSGGGNHTLQKAYDGAGTGAGRSITISDQAVQIYSENVSARDTDASNAALVLRKNLATTLWPTFQGEVGLDVPILYTFAGGVIVRYPIADQSGNDYLRASETVNIVASNKINFTRAGVNLTFGAANTELLQMVDMVEISGSSLGNDGLYYIDEIFSGTQLSAWELNGGGPSLTSESGITARVFRAVARIGSRLGSIALAPISDLLRDKGEPIDHTGVTINVPAGAVASDAAVDIRSGKWNGLNLFKITNEGGIDALLAVLRETLSVAETSTLGTSLLTSRADEARIVTRFADETDSPYSLLWEMDCVTTGRAKVRVYVSDNATPIYGSSLSRGLVITINARWDAAAALWYRDTGGLVAPTDISNRYDLGQEGCLVSCVHFSDSADGWIDANWRATGEGSRLFRVLPVTTSDPFYQRMCRIQMEDGYISILNSSTGGSYPSGAPIKDTLYAKNMIKAWARFRTDAAGNLTIRDEFNIADIVILPTSTNLEVTFRTPFADTPPYDDYAVVFGDMETLGGLKHFKVNNATITNTGFQMTAVDGDGILWDFATEVVGCSLMVIGRQ